jgi:hypothetical protein
MFAGRYLQMLWAKKELLGENKAPNRYRCQRIDFKAPGF